MGKVKRARQKFHLERAKSMNDLTSIGPPPSDSILPPYENLGASRLTSFKISDNLFEGIEIPTHLNRSLDNDDGKSIISTKSSFKDRNLTKKQKRNLRHDAFMRKLDVIQLARKAAKDRKRGVATKTPITGDMQILADALPSLDQLKRPGVVAAQPKCLQKTKTRQKQALRDIASFKKVLNDPGYKADPTAAISEYIQEKIRKELMDES